VGDGARAARRGQRRGEADDSRDSSDGGVLHYDTRRNGAGGEDMGLNHGGRGGRGGQREERDEKQHGGTKEGEGDGGGGRGEVMLTCAVNIAVFAAF